MTDVRTDAVVEVTPGGPYHVTGGIPLFRVRKIQGPKEGSFVEWEKYEQLSTEDEYWLCRCGHATNKPFCTGMHEKVGFEGTETAPTNAYRERSEVLGGTKVTVSDDRGICAHAAFCSNEITNVWKAAKKLDDDSSLADTAVRMVRNCPSGALSMEIDGASGEAELVREIWIQEDASILLRGGITVRRADGQPIETRNRMALCRCGQSNIKPLCDGSHAEAAFTDG
ncbi:MAG: CDGSH iron-sulfur domain-containing protein [Actinomycetota bacterium]